jgi:hypothetical protein
VLPEVQGKESLLSMGCNPRGEGGFASLKSRFLVQLKRVKMAI